MMLHLSVTMSLMHPTNPHFHTQYLYCIIISQQHNFQPSNTTVLSYTCNNYYSNTTFNCVILYIITIATQLSTVLSLATQTFQHNHTQRLFLTQSYSEQHKLKLQTTTIERSHYLATTEASWSLMRPSPSSMVSRVSRENSMLTVSTEGNLSTCSLFPCT